VVGPYSARGSSDAFMTTMTKTLSAAVMAEFDAPSARKLASSDDEGDVSTVELHSRQTSNSSSESEASLDLPVSGAADEVVEERKLSSHARRTLEDVITSLPHFKEARSDADDSSEDEDAVLRIGQLARLFALGRQADACSSRRRGGH